MFDNFWIWFVIGGYFGGWLATFIHLRQIIIDDGLGNRMPFLLEIACDAVFALSWPVLWALLFYSWIMDATR